MGVGADTGREGFDQLSQWMRDGHLRTTMNLEQIDECIRVNEKHIGELDVLRSSAQLLADVEVGIGEAGPYLGSAKDLAQKFQLKAYGGPNNVYDCIASYMAAARGLGELLLLCRAQCVDTDESNATALRRPSQ